MLEGAAMNSKELTMKSPSARKKRKMKKQTPGVKPSDTGTKRKVGRPRRYIEPDQSQRSLLDMFAAATNEKTSTAEQGIVDQSSTAGQDVVDL